jgi:hypothetical protein
MADELRTQGWRFSADPRRGPVTGVIRKDPRTKALSLWTTDRRRMITRLFVKSNYTTPRHTPGTEMTAYTAFMNGYEWSGRASGLILTLRRRKKRE